MLDACLDVLLPSRAGSANGRTADPWWAVLTMLDGSRSSHRNPLSVPALKVLPVSAERPQSPSSFAENLAWARWWRRDGRAAAAKREMDELGEMLGRVLPRIIAVEDLALSDRRRAERVAAAVASSRGLMTTMDEHLGDFEAVVRLAPEHLQADDVDHEADLRLIRMSLVWIKDAVHLRARLAEIEAGPAPTH